MIGDAADIKQEFMPVAKATFELLRPLVRRKEPLSISIAGESGSGKTSLSANLAWLFEKDGQTVAVFHQDDYYNLPPHDNHLAREADINHVGISEVNLELLDSHIRASKSYQSTIIKPLVDYKHNVILQETYDCSETNITIAEGTYVSILESIDVKIFMERDYHDTKGSRYERARDPLTPFMEEILLIEHQIIKNLESLCHIKIDRDNKVHCKI